MMYDVPESRTSGALSSGRSDIVRSAKQSRLFKTNNLDEAHDLIASRISPHKLELWDDESQLDVDYRGICHNTFSILRAGLGASLRVRPDEQRDFFYAQTPLCGDVRVTRGQDDVEISPLNTLIVSPDTAYHMDLATRTQRVVVALHNDAFVDHLESMLCQALNTPLTFDLTKATPEASLAWRNYISSISRVIFAGRDEAQKLKRLNRFLEPTIMMALEFFPHNYVDALADDHLDFDTVRLNQAIEYIRSNLKSNPTLMNIASAACMSGRNLQLLFRKQMDETPLQYVRRQRLAAIKLELETAPAGTRVTDILIEYGVTSCGHFTQQYRTTFGCTPQQSLSSG